MAKATEEDNYLPKLERYCAWQDRCVAEVKEKMAALNIPHHKQRALLEHLEDLGYLDEARYARHFAQGRFRLKKWGRIKIRYALMGKQVAERSIDQALKTLDEEEYLHTLQHLLAEKKKSLRHIQDPYQLNHKASLYAINKGFEPDLVWGILKASK